MSKQLTQIDHACMQRVRELTRPQDSVLEIARSLARTAQDAQWQHRDNARDAARKLASVLDNPDVPAKDVDALVRLIRTQTRKFKEWRQIARAYREYADELSHS